MKRKALLPILFLVLVMSCGQVFATAAKPQENNAASSGGIAQTARSYCLMEQSSGKVLLEKDSEVQYPPASITKIMTVLLINDAIDAGKINWDDKVTISEHAAHMGGSQVFMEPGEEQPFVTL